jgi:hypothetical protein
VDLTNPTTWNRYGYVADDPVNFSDPRGLFLAVAADGGGGDGDDGGGDDGGDDDGDGTVYDLGVSFSVTGTTNANAGSQTTGDDNSNTGPVLIAFAPQPPSPIPTRPARGPARHRPRPPNCPPQYQSFFNLMTPIADGLATTWNTNVDFILALSAYESGWDPVYSGATHSPPINNPFGLTQAGGNDLTFPSLQAAAAYWSQNDGAYIQGDTTIQQFAAALQPHYNTVNPNWTGALISVYNSVERRKADCTH